MYRQNQEIERCAQDAGLEDTKWVHKKLMRGRLYGVEVEWQQTSFASPSGKRLYSTGSTSTFSPLLPASVEIREKQFFRNKKTWWRSPPPQDPVLVIADNRITRHLLDNDLNAALALTAKRGVFRIDHGLLRIATGGKMVDNLSFLADGVAVTTRLAAQWRDRATEIEALGFAPTDTDGKWLGTVDRAAFEIYETREKNEYTTYVWAPLAKPLPPRTEVLRKKARVPKGARPLGDVWLDPMIDVWTTDIEAVAERLCQETVRAPLLEIVHGHLHSRVNSTHIVLRREGPIVGDCGLSVVAELRRALG